ncbi:glutaredoxin-related protein [Myriangium duriaei CBS 260.36]|uniref:Glutaredoxin-related protein n=1 Tax=Myriangium duriaei CBS 260.36 TaxID=1168546 RepID=A0A9P4ITW3_9PEZI|nr:glutaredoxin-related protein [Myriangium duriaei CBS 260.36]
MATSTVHTIPSDSAFDTHLSSLPPTTLTILYFHAPWAEPCKQMSTIISTLASTYPATSPPSMSFLSLDAEDLSDVSERYNVTQVPHIVLQRGPDVLDALSGGDATRVRSLIEKHAGAGTSGNGSALPPLQSVTRPAPTADTGDAPLPAGGAAEQKEALHQRLAELVKAAPVMLFMKGTPSAPQCGFSRQTVAMLREKGIRYGFFNILADDDVRQGLKEFSEWPTFPQVYVGGELVGGLDILKEEFENDPDFLADYAVSRPTAAA